MGYQLSEEDCQKWFNNRSVHPFTGAKIYPGTYDERALEKLCKQYTTSHPLLRVIYRYSPKDLTDYIKNPANVVDFMEKIPELKHQYAWKALIEGEILAEFEPRTKLIAIMHDHMIAQHGVDKVVELYEAERFHIDLFKKGGNELRNMIYRIWPIDKLAKIRIADIIGNHPVIVYEAMESNLEGVKIVIERKVPFTNSVYANAVQWSGSSGKSDIFEYLMQHTFVSPNVEESDGKTPLFSMLVSQAYSQTFNIHDNLQKFLRSGASIYASRHDPNNGVQTLLGFVYSRNLDKVLNLNINADIKKIVFSKNFVISSDPVVATFRDYLKLEKIRDDSERTIRLVDQFYMYNGHLTASENEVVRNIRKDESNIGKFMCMYDKKHWLNDDVMKSLVVKCIKIGESTSKHSIYEIYLYHPDFKKPVGVIGNFIARLTDEVKAAAPMLEDPSLIEKALNNLHAKGRLLLKTFPYRAVVDIHVFDAVDMDRLKLNEGIATHNYFSAEAHIDAYYDMIMSIQAALQKRRYVPKDAIHKVPQPYSRTYKEFMDQQADFVNKPEQLAAALAKSRSPVVTRNPKRLSPAKAAAINTIARKVKSRVDKLKTYYEESMSYIDNLPIHLRQKIYRAVNGHIMQGPYSPIRRFPGGLLYAREDAMNDVIAMVEVTMRAPRFPMRYTLYRGMALPEVPKPNHTNIYQELPFSTTFISNYALGWMMAKKRSACCLLEVLCHAGTGGLYLSKLPWMDPWTSMNSAIFQRIAPSNASNRFHIKVNSQNEFLMQPYRLKVVGQRKKNFKHMMQEQVEKLDTHYEFDAVQRGLLSLQENNADLLEQEIDVYQVALEPISLYCVQLPLTNRKLLRPKNLYGSKYEDEFKDQKLYMEYLSCIFFSPEELEATEPEAYQNLMDAIRITGAIVQKLIVKGKYVGPKTF